MKKGNSVSNLVVKQFCTGTWEVDLSQQRYLSPDLGRKEDAPINIYFIEGGEKNIIVDTGFGPLEKWKGSWIEKNGKLPIARKPEEDIMVGLEKWNLKPEEVDIVINTHLHLDHVEYNHLFRKAEIVIQVDELRYCYVPYPPMQYGGPTYEAAWYASLYDVEYIHALRKQIHWVKGDAQIIPGVRVILTAGHSPGHQSVAVDTAKGVAVITGDAVSAKENWEGEIPPGTHLDAVAAWESMRKLKGIADIPIFSHDPTMRSKTVFP